VLTVYSPSPFASGTEVAAAIGAAAAQTAKNIFSCWVGGSAMREAQQVAAAKGVLAHDSPEKAIGVFLGIVNYERNRELLLQMPPSVTEEFVPDLDGARAAVAEALAAGAERAAAARARQLLLAYGIESGDAVAAGNIDAAIDAADEIGYPVDIALALASDAEHTLLARELRSPEDIRIAVRGLRARARAEFPGVRVGGYRLRPSVARSGLPPLRLGVADDAVFGPVIYLGASGGDPRDNVVALPPLNRRLAMDLVTRGRFAREAAEEERDALETGLARCWCGCRNCSPTSTKSPPSNSTRSTSKPAAWWRANGTSTSSRAAATPASAASPSAPTRGNSNSRSTGAAGSC
jgi:acetyltransferase